MKSKTLSFIKFIFGWPLSFLALFFLWKFFTPHIPQIQKSVHQANIPMLLFAMLFFFLYYVFRITLWRKMLSFWGHTVPFSATAWNWSIAELNRYVPGNIWSIVSRNAVFSQFGIPQSKLLIGWVAESFLVLLGSMTVSLLGLTLLFFHILPASFPLRDVLYQSTFFAIIVLDLLWIFHEKIKYISWLPKKISSLPFAPYTSFQLLVYASLSFLFFGLGTYFTISSLFSLPLQQMFEFVGLFSASFFLGYLSIIAPMGLGVRELVMTSGLLGFTSQSVVGFSVIFARIFLIISELIFLGFAFIMHKVKPFPSLPQLKHIQKYMHEYILAMGIALYILYFTIASFLRYINFYTGRFDLGNMDQTVWNTIHGRIFQLTDPNGTNVMSRLGTHADFILVLLSPFYLLWQDPRMLLLLQTIILALGAVFVYVIAKQVFKYKTISLIIALGYLLSPSVQFANLYDFHAVTFATTFFLGAWYFLQKKKIFLTLLFLFLAGLTKEEVWLVVGFFGIYMAIFQQRRWLGLSIVVVGFSAFYILIWKLIPIARGGQHFALSYYSDFGSTPTSVIKNIFLSPRIILNMLLEKSRLLYLYDLFLPLGFLPILGLPFLLFAAPDLGINLLSNNAQLREIYYQYTSVITPFIFIALVYGVHKIVKYFPKLPYTFFSWYIAIFALLGAYLLGPLPGTVHQNIDMFVKKQMYRKDIDAFLKSIPHNLSVAATNNLGSHLSHRQLIYTIPVGIDKADVIVFLLNDPYAQPSLHAQKEMAVKLQKDPNYNLLFADGDFIAFQKKMK